MECPECNRQNPDDSKFCNECGCRFVDTLVTTESTPPMTSERKHVTIMFSDMSGYTAMTERLDPEDVKRIMSDIFGEITAIIKRYDGFIERFIGDAVMAVFGVPIAHEDDPIRAIRAALEIHAAVENLSPQYEGKIGQPLSMHTGINTGLVVTGEVDVEKGTHGLTGDAINLASRLEGIANSGEIVIGPETYQHTINNFEFEVLRPIKLKGKKEPINIYLLRSAKKQSLKTHRLQGLQAELTGRENELTFLKDAAERLQHGTGSIITICGDAGTGKSRLKKEFKEYLDPLKIQWYEGHAFDYTRGTPYYPLLNLLISVFQIAESDPPEIVRKKVEAGVGSILSENGSHTAHIGSLFSITYSEMEGASPEYWKSKLRESILKLLLAIANKKPTVICFEDLHWADSSFIDLLKQLSLRTCNYILFICTYRSSFELFDKDLSGDVNKWYRQIYLIELSAVEMETMLKSLLSTQKVPVGLNKRAQYKAEGNPFHIEELINWLIERKILTQDKGEWLLTREITDTDIPPTIQGLLTARIDLLNSEFKRLLQNASVIGRAFLYRILKNINEIESDISKYLIELENLDLIRTQSIEPELEYIFKHALTQEVVYNGLLIAERKTIHERIGQTIEVLYNERLPEFYEALAYHFSRGQSNEKALEYLIKSGDKSLARYSFEEAHHYFKMAYDILLSSKELSKQEIITLIDVINRWGYAFYYTGEIKEWIALLKHHQAIVESIEDKARIGMYYAWFGCALITACKPRKAYEYLSQAKELGEHSKDTKVVGYACTFLSCECLCSGDFKNGMTYGIQAQNISKSFPSDQYLYFKSLSAISYIYYFQGKPSLLFKGAEQLLEYGKKTANSRSEVFGYWINALGHFAKGDLPATRKNSEMSIQAAVDPFYSQFAKTTLGMSYLIDGRLNGAEKIFMSLLDHCEIRGIDLLTQFADLFLSFINFAKGNMTIGMQKIEETQNILKNNNMKVWYGMSESMLGTLHLKLLTGAKPSMSIIVRNIIFLITNIPYADKKSEEHFKNAIEIFNNIGAKANLGQAFLGLARLHKVKKRNMEAKKYYSKAMKLFQECEAHIYLAQAKDEAASLK